MVRSAILVLTISMVHLVKSSRACPGKMLIVIKLVCDIRETEDTCCWFVEFHFYLIFMKLFGEENEA